MSPAAAPAGRPVRRGHGQPRHPAQPRSGHPITADDARPAARAPFVGHFPRHPAIHRHRPGRIPYGRRVRDGVPLPGRSPTEVLSQLAYRVCGPLHPGRIRVVLDYHGLEGRPAAPLAEIAARQHVTSRTVSNHVAAVRAAGARLPLTDELISQVTRASTPGDDHLARVRTAGTLGLPAPAAPPRQPPGTSSASTVPPAQLRAARAAARVLAAVGPLPLDTLLAAVTRSRRFRTPAPLTATGLAAGLTAAGATPGPGGHWHPPPGTTVPDRYRAIAAAGGRDLTRQEMIAVLTAAGYSRSSADGLMSSCHPLFIRTGPGRYMVIGTPAPNTVPAAQS